MSKEKYKNTHFLRNINELFKQNRYQEIKEEFENNPPDFNSFYSLSARLKYIHSVVLRKITKSYQLWFQESSICFSPNYLPYVPDSYFDEWIETFYSVDKKDAVQWLPHDISLKCPNNENTFLKVNASFSKKIVFEGDPAEVKVSIISNLPKEIRDASIAVQYYSKTTNNSNFDDNDNYSLQNKPKMLMIAQHQAIVPNKRLFYRSSVCLSDQLNNNATNVVLTDVILIINSVKLIFSIELKGKGSEFSNRQQEIRIEPKDIGCSLIANYSQPGFVGVPVPIHLKFSTSDFAGYSIILSVTCDQKDTFVSRNYDMSGKMEDVTIDAEKPFKECNLTFYAFSPTPKEINLELKWHYQRDGKSGKDTRQDLPLEFQFPFILKAKVFNESSSCRTEVNVQKTPLLTESSYSILTEFMSNCPWPITIKSFEIVPEKENKEEEEEYIRKRLSNVDLDISDIYENNIIDDPAISFQKPIINLPIVLEPNDCFSAFTKFSTGKKPIKSINLGTLLIRYFMHSTIYKGTHLYVFKVPSSENVIVNKKNQSVLNISTNTNAIPRKGSAHNTNSSSNTKKNSKIGLTGRGSKSNFSRSSCNTIIPLITDNTSGNKTVNVSNDQKLISIEKLKLHVEFDFPSRGSQFEMCELTIKMTNVSETPLEIVYDIKPTKDFLMAGTLSTQIGLFPYDPAELSLKFFPLAHGSLTFPEITIKSAQSWDYCYWSANPTIFISYPVAS